MDRRQKQLIEYLAKNGKFVDATKTEIGQELLKDMLNGINALFPKVYNEKASAQELAEFRILRGMCDKWTTRIADYNNKLTEWKNLETKNE